MRQHSKSESLPLLEEKWRGRWGYLFWQSDESWAAIEPHHPINLPGAGRIDDRLVISGTPHVLKTGSRWRDCPKEYGPNTTVHNRSNRSLYCRYKAEHNQPMEGSA